MDPLVEDRQEPIPSASVCLDGITRHLQAYEVTIDKLTRENADLRQQLALVLQKLEDANAQAVRYAFLLQEAQPGAQPGGAGAVPAPPSEAQARSVPQTMNFAAQTTGAPGRQLQQSVPGQGSGGIRATIVSMRQVGITTGFPVGGKGISESMALGALPQTQGDTPTCIPLASYVIHNRAVHSLIFASNYLITSSRDGSTRGWVLPPEAVGKLSGAQGTPAAATVPLRTYRCDCPVLAAALIDGRLVISNSRCQIALYASPIRCLETSVPYADVSSVDADLVRPDKHRRVLTLPTQTWCFCPAPSGLLCLGGGYCSYLAVEANSYCERLRTPLLGPDTAGPFQGELLLPTHLASLGSRHFVVVRERYADPNGAMLDAGNSPLTLHDLQGLRRTGLRLFRLAPKALATAASTVPPASGPATPDPQAWDLALQMPAAEKDAPGLLQPTGLAAMSPLEGTAGILLASTTCPAAKLFASDGTCLLRCELPDSPPEEAFSAIAVHNGRLYATPFCGDGECPKLNVYNLEADSRLALKELASRAISAAKARPTPGTGEQEKLPPLLLGDSFPALRFCLVGSFVLDGLYGPAASLAARGSYDGKLVVVAVGGRDGEVCIKGISG